MLLTQDQEMIRDAVRDFLRRARLADKNRCGSCAVNMGGFRYQAKAR